MATRAGFVSFVRGQMGATATAVPDESASFDVAFDLAVTLCKGFELATSRADILDLLTYNMAGHYLYVFGTESVFSTGRATYGLNVVGLVNSASDQGTSGALVLPDWVTKAGPMESEFSKTPQGRMYLILAGQLGSVIMVA